MLRPQDTETRERRSLTGLWDFALDSAGAGRAEQWWRGRIPNAQQVPVPASYNDLFADNTGRTHVGDAWYQTTTRIPRGWDNQRVILRFDSATHRATVWVGDVEIMSHEGGYTPFEADITDFVVAGSECRITAVVNNELTWQTIPPGLIETTPDGVRQRYFHDFFNYAGLHRPVWLYTTPTTHLTDITVTTGLDAGTGTVRYQVATAGENCTVGVVLRDMADVVVATADGSAGTLTIQGVHPWAPGDGYLYDLEITLADDGGTVDVYHQSVGVRTVRIDGTRFLINDKPFYFTGFGKHEDAAVRGKGHDDAFMVHDFHLMKWIGANSFRTSHYPYAEEVLDYADRHGIVVIDETAAVGMFVSVGGDMFGIDVRETFSPDTINDATREVHAQAISELIARDKNHPSVVIWSLANEPESHTEGSRAYFEPLFELARRADPSRPLGFVSSMLSPAEECTVSQYADILMVNRYYGWYFDPGDLAAAERHLESALTTLAQIHPKPIIVTEYGADAVAGLHGLADIPWTEEYQADVLDMCHLVFDRIEAVVGEHVWNFADFATAPGFMRVDGNKKGVFTRDRQPKASAFRLRARWGNRG